MSIALTNEVRELRERVEVLKSQVSETCGTLADLLTRVQRLEDGKSTLTLPLKKVK